MYRFISMLVLCLCFAFVGTANSDSAFDDSFVVDIDVGINHSDMIQTMPIVFAAIPELDLYQVATVEYSTLLMDTESITVSADDRGPPVKGTSNILNESKQESKAVTAVEPMCRSSDNHDVRSNRI